eukprot:CAMPEP_0197664590 /NCGR_PEP_ID=MMETSP1338-20131121/58732_1 /TAXON_ID=43686 ORGANISM="Pelagodinium beii, Strain RCC1491" /NCGR_SAMPLE_ID=MMETSP1338 /ASSEMBLY_ACC=CAM_ASM_000754 /LENGTH=899 /DNA_ID=CAMNT_0043243271 /DNA_START=33 /DNA_END=2732 /DNA_ORIENTATION=-
MAEEGELPGMLRGGADGEDDPSIEAMAPPQGLPPLPAAVARLSLPIEETVAVKSDLVASFDHVEVDMEADDFFNDLGRHFPRDNSNLVKDNDELLERVNDYPYGSDKWARCRALTYATVTFGVYYMQKIRTIPAGNFGHYISTERHMLKPPGRHVLMSDEEEWLDDIPIDDPTLMKREIGIKTLLVVPENHVAGAFRVGGGDGAGGDGDFVLIGQGRHVLSNSSYREIVVEKLESDMVRLGPVTVLYIKEGNLGGAYERTSGTYRIFHPGPPYLLHEKDYENIELQERKLEGFKIGPITFTTVKDGEMGGAYEKASGKYQLLPPGNTYQLHEKDFDGIEVKPRSDYFKLGPYTFLTVAEGSVAGAYRKRGGEFLLLPPGQTYQLNENEFTDAVRVKRDRHVVRCGPITFLTLQEGMLMGAYRTRDGKFEEFYESADGEGAHFELHEREYHGLTVVNKYSKEVQDFGPNRIVTIPEGSCGVFEREGRIEIKDPGFYRVSAEYSIRENIPLVTNSERWEDQEFLTKDSLSMRIHLVILWSVQDAYLTAKWPGTLDELRDEFRSKALSGLIMQLRRHNRADLLPTRQDLMMQAGSEDVTSEDAQEDLKAKLKAAQDASRQVLDDAQNSCIQLLKAASTSAGWGIVVNGVNIDSIELADERIIADMQAIAQAQLSMKRKEAEARAALAAANVDREAKMHSEKAKAEIQQAMTASQSQVKVAEARAESEISLMEATNSAKAQAEAKKIELDMQLQLEESQAALEESKATRSARAEAEKQKIELETQRLAAEAQVSIEETRLRGQRLAAETEASSIKALADAEYEKGRKEQEVAAMMPQQELELKRLALAVEGMKHFAAAAWRHPDDAQRAHLHLFWEEMKPFMRMGPMTAAEMKTVAESAAPKR